MSGPTRRLRAAMSAPGAARSRRSTSSAPAGAPALYTGGRGAGNGRERASVVGSVKARGALPRVPGTLYTDGLVSARHTPAPPYRPHASLAGPAETTAAGPCGCRPMRLPAHVASPGSVTDEPRPAPARPAPPHSAALAQPADAVRRKGGRGVPRCAAAWRGVLPLIEAAFTSAPASSCAAPRRRARPRSAREDGPRGSRSRF